MVPATNVTFRPTIACLSCSRIAVSSAAFADTSREGSPKAFLCRRCAAISVLAPFRRKRLGAVYHRTDFPRWAVLAIDPGFPSRKAGEATVARFIREAIYGDVP